MWRVVFSGLLITLLLFLSVNEELTHKPGRASDAAGWNLTNSQLPLPVLLGCETPAPNPHHAWCPVCKSSQWNICPQCNLTACSNFYSFPWKEILKTLGISKCQASRSWLLLAAWLVWVPPSVPRCPMNGRPPVGHPRSSQPPGFCRVCGTTVLETLSELGTADLISPPWSWKVSWVLPEASRLMVIHLSRYHRGLISYASHGNNTKRKKQQFLRHKAHVWSVERGGNYAVV